MPKIQRSIVRRGEDETTVSNFEFPGSCFLETGERAKRTSKFCAECGTGITEAKTYCSPCAAERMPGLGGTLGPYRARQKVGPTPKSKMKMKMKGRMRVAKKAKPKSAPRAIPPKTRTSIWLADDLRVQLDRRAKTDKRSLAFTIESLLRKGLGKPVKDAPDATIFG